MRIITGIRSRAPRSRAALLLAAASWAHIASAAHGTDFTWSQGGASAAWLSTGNWTPTGAPSNSADTATFAGAGMQLGIGINFSTLAGTLDVGRITLSSGVNRTIGNSTDVAGNLNLFGAGGVLISNTSAGILTIAPTAVGGTAPMAVRLNASGSFEVTNAAASLIISSSITETGGARSITKTGSGLFTLSGANTFTGGLAINSGAVQLGNTAALNSTSPNAVSFGAVSNGVLRLNGNSVTIAGLDTDATTPGSPVVENNSAPSGTPATLTVSKASGSSSFAGVLRDGAAGGALSLTKSGGGALALSGANSYTGATIVAGGTLRLGNISALGSTAGSTTVNSNAALDLNGQSLGFEQILINGTGLSDGGALINSNTTTAASSNGAITLGSASSVGGAGSTMLAATISGNFSLTKVGAGAVTLAGSNIYTGATILSEGKLLSTGTHAGAGDYNINAGTFGGAHASGQSITLATGKTFTIGSGVAPARNASSQGTIAPGATGNNSIAKLTLNTDSAAANGDNIGVTKFATGGAYAWEIKSQTVSEGTSQDLLDLDAVTVSAAPGTFTIRIISLKLDNTSGPVEGWIADRSTNPVDYTIARSSKLGAFTQALLDRFVIDASQFNNGSPVGWTLDVANGGTELRLHYVPEPRGTTLIALMSLSALRRQRARNSFSPCIRGGVG